MTAAETPATNINRLTITLLLAIAASACETVVANPDFCCASEADCASFGVDELRPCDVGQSCAPTHLCVATECETAADCNSPEAPSCALGLCVAGCTADDDCAGIVGQPHCSADGACVGCVSNAQCPAGSEICDVDASECRGCRADAECGSGVCIEADGVCADPQSLIYVASNGVDSGLCSEATPCRTLAFALGRVTTTKFVIRILGVVSLGPTPITLRGGVVLDGSNSNLASVATPTFIVEAATLEGLDISGPGQSTEIVQVAAGGTLKLGRSVLRNARLSVRALGKLELFATKLRDAEVDCNNANCSFRDSSIERSRIDATDTVEFVRNRFDAEGVGGFSVGGGMVTIENNLFVDNREDRNAIDLFVSILAGSGTFRFNTLVNTSTVATPTAATQCLGVDVSSNIFALNATQPFSGECVPNHSLFDKSGAGQANQGTGNVSGDLARFFVDPFIGDFHLATGSPAIGLGQPGLLMNDVDGNPRPLPVGSTPDAGAFESPK